MFVISALVFACSFSISTVSSTAYTVGADLLERKRIKNGQSINEKLLRKSPMPMCKQHKHSLPVPVKKVSRSDLAALNISLHFYITCLLQTLPNLSHTPRRVITSSLPSSCQRPKNPGRMPVRRPTRNPPPPLPPPPPNPTPSSA